MKGVLLWRGRVGVFLRETSTWRAVHAIFRASSSGGVTLTSITPAASLFPVIADHDLQQSAFYSWRRRLALRDRAATALEPLPTPAFLPVTVVDPPIGRGATAIEIVLADGCRVRVRAGCDRQLLSDVLALLARGEGRPC